MDGVILGVALTEILGVAVTDGVLLGDFVTVGVTDGEGDGNGVAVSVHKSKVQPNNPPGPVIIN
jgi:hypothetical protein